MDKMGREALTSTYIKGLLSEESLWVFLELIKFVAETNNIVIDFEWNFPLHEGKLMKFVVKLKLKLLNLR